MSDLKTGLKISVYAAPALCFLLPFKTHTSSDNVLTYMVIVYFLSLSFMTLEIFVGDQRLYFSSPRSSGSITPSSVSCFVDATVLFISLWQNYLKLPYVSAFEICAICSREATNKNQSCFFLVCLCFNNWSSDVRSLCKEWRVSMLSE